MTVCEIHRNNVEERIKDMEQNNWQAKNKLPSRSNSRSR